jgi:SAM-dependent methyltransferase
MLASPVGDLRASLPVFCNAVYTAVSATSQQPANLEKLYAARFAGRSDYRSRVWRVLCAFFSRWIPPTAAVLDLGSGHCEFINAVQCGRKLAMDLNPDTARKAHPDVHVIQQDCSDRWKLPPANLDIVFTSNFFEHLPTKAALEVTLLEVHRALVPGGRLIAMGPNIKYVRGHYWDFFDHHLPLTELSLAEALTKNGFEIELNIGRFLPYTMSGSVQYPIWMLRAYLAMPFAWRFFGKQFLVIARKPI